MMTVEKLWQEKYRKIIIRVVTVVSVFVFMKYILTLVMPFFLAFCLVSGLQPVVRRLEKVLHIKKRVIAVLLLFVSACLLGILLWYLATEVCELVGAMSRNMSEYESIVNGFIHSCCQKAEQITGIRGAVMEDAVYLHINNFTSDMKDRAVPKLMNRSVDYVRIFLTIAGFLAMTLIATVLLAKDFRKIQEDLQKYKWFLTAEEIRTEIGYLAIRYAKAQLMIMGTISILSGVVLWIAGIHNGFLIGLFTGIMDAMPFIGTGIVLIPMALWQLVQGNLGKCVIIALLYVSCVLLREFLEPKLIGKEMDIYPVVVLLAIYTGIQLYGLAGVVLGPLSFLLIREIWRKNFR